MIIESISQLIMVIIWKPEKGREGMNKVDSLIKKVVPKKSLQDELSVNNPYIGKSCDELLDYMSGDNYRAPPMRTWEWTQFMFAMMHASGAGLRDDEIQEEMR